MRCKQLLTVIAAAFCCAVSAGSMIDNGNFSAENPHAGKEFGAKLKGANWQYSLPLRFPARWRLNFNRKDGVIRYPDPGPAGKGSAFTILGTVMSGKIVSVRYPKSQVTVSLFSKSSEAGILSVYMYGNKSAFLGELRTKIAPSEKWTESKYRIEVPENSRKQKVRTLILAFSSGPKQPLTLANVRADLTSPEEPAAPPPAVKVKRSGECIDFEGGRILNKQSRTFKFRQADNDTRQIRFSLDARIDWSSLGGYAPAMQITVNGGKLPGRRLLNKPLRFRNRSGGGSFWTNPEGSSCVLMYSPDFSDAIKTNVNYIYGLYEKNQEPYRFVFDLTGLTRHVGENEITVTATWQPIVIRNVYVEFDRTFQPRINDTEEKVSAIPTGPLPDLRGRRLKPAALDITAAPGQSFVMKTDSGDFQVSTRLSMPDGKWLTVPDNSGTTEKQVWKTPDYVMTRTIRKKAHRLLVTDRFTNLQNRPVGVILENTVRLPAKSNRTTVGGRELMLSEFSIGGGNPSFMAEIGKSCFAIVLEDDILRSQARGRFTDRTLTFLDRRLAIPAKGSHTLEWSLYYNGQANYYDMINEIRRDWGVNFTLSGPFSFPYGGGTGGIPFNYWIRKEITADRVKEFLDRRKAKTIITHVPGNYSVPPNKSTREKPYLGHGTALQDRWFKSWRDQTRAMIGALHKYAPDVQVYCYLHKNICTEQNNREKYKDSGVLPGGTYDKLSRGVSAYYVPTANNSYGKKLAETYRYILDNLGGNIYMDEICLGVTETGKYPEWDQCTGRIDPKTHRLIETISKPNLLERPWMEQMMAELKKRGRHLIGNAPPVTAALRDFKTVFFIEECMGEGGMYSMHLSTPLGFCYRLGTPGYMHFKNCLRNGIVCYQYSGEWNALCFPLTPREIRPGYVIADERIITGCSGTFGWHEGSDAEIFVYDGQGKPASAAMVTKRQEDGKFLFDVRIPSDHLAILVRKSK